MSQPAIRVENLSKQYRIGARELAGRTFVELLSDTMAAPFRRLASLRGNGTDKANAEETFWALKDVSFEVQPGEVVGIIGRNGAGKSTLLKILSRITEPTEGRVEVHGRVASLLEVGTGFHPELTGRENVLLNGAILGMGRREILSKFDEIVAFAEIERFIDTPVKRYSSGMYVRLAFAVAAHLDPEILMVDEVLSVGDAAFQKKCLGKMGDVARGGRTVLFVSHNMVAVQALCARALVLDQGAVTNAGPTDAVVSHYLAASAEQQTMRVWEDQAAAPGNSVVRIRRVGVRPEGGSPSDVVDTETPLVMEFEYWNLQAEAVLNLSLHVHTGDGVMAFNTGPVREPVWNGRPFPVGLFRSTCRVPARLLNDGQHRVDLLVVRDLGVVYRLDDALVFDVQDSTDGRGAWFGKWPGVLRPDLVWTTALIGPAWAIGSS